MEKGNSQYFIKVDEKDQTGNVVIHNVQFADDCVLKDRSIFISAARLGNSHRIAHMYTTINYIKDTLQQPENINFSGKRGGGLLEKI